MSLTSSTHSSSTLSTSSSSASTKRQSHPTPTHQEHTHHHRRNVHSAPAAYTPSQSRAQAFSPTPSLSSASSASSSTAIASSNDDEKPTKPNHLSEDDFYATQINAELAANAKAIADKEIAKASAKAKRGCMGAIADEFDFGYANVPSRGSKHGRKSAGGPGLGKCDLM